RVARAAVAEGALINSAASESEMGSPSRGGRPATIAVAEPDSSFIITGRKTFTTMAPALQFVIVSATIKAERGEEAGQFLLEAGLPGLGVEETWDTMGMRATGSHDLVLDGVRVPSSALLSRRPYGPQPDTSGSVSAAVPPAPPDAS